MIFGFGKHLASPPTERPPTEMRQGANIGLQPQLIDVSQPQRLITR